jgi:hypothetical protein
VAKRRSDLEVEIDIALENWLAVEEAADRVPWEAWTNYRVNVLGIKTVFKKLTVPTQFPPSTIGAAKDYVDVLKKICRLNGGGRSKVPDNPSAWMGEI